MVYSGGVRSFVQAAAVCALVISALPSVRAAASTSAASVSCQPSDGDKKFGIQSISDETCAKGGLGCYTKNCRYCKVLDTDKSKHLGTCLSLGVAFTPTTPVVVSQEACHVSSGDVAMGISAVTDSSCLSGGLGCYNDHCRYCKVTKTPASSGFMACSKLDKSYSTTAQAAAVTATASPTNAPATNAPTLTVTEAPTTTEPPTAAPTSTVTDAPKTATPTEAPTSDVTDAPVATETPTEAPTSVVTDTPETPTGAPTSTVTDTPITTPTEAPTLVATDIPATDAPAEETCSIVPSVGDLEGGVTIVTDPLCVSGGVGCLSDVCRFCKLKTTPHSDPYMDCALVATEPTTPVAPDATTETPSVVIDLPTAPEIPVASDFSTDAPTETPVATEVPTETPVTSDVSTDAPTEMPAATEVPTETPVASDVSTDAPTETPAATEVPTEAPVSSDVTTDAPTETPASSDVSTEAPSTSTVVPDVPVVDTEAPALPTKCALVASADDTELGIGVATDSSCKSGGVGCIDDICRFCQVTTTIKSAPYVDCALLQDGSSGPVVDTTVAPTDVATESPDATTETPFATDAPTEPPVSDASSVETETPAITEAPTSPVETDAPATTTTAPEQPICGAIAAEGDIAVGVHIATDATCSGGGIGCINDLCRFCKVETTPQSEIFVDCFSLAGFSLDSVAPAISDPLATPAPIAPCELVASPGDASVGIRILTDSTCAAGGVGCISDVCRFCKVTTSIQSATFVDCVTVDGYTPETDAPVTATPDATTSTSSSEGTCTQIASEGDLAVGVGIATDDTCRDGGVGCIDDVCRFCQISTTVQSEAFISCTTLPGYTPRTETPVDTTTTSTTTDAPIAQVSCDLVVSAGDAAVGISITGDAACAVGGVGCIDSVCRFCKVTTTVQSAAFVDCTSVAGFTLATDTPADATTSPVVSGASTLAPAVSASCGLVASEGDAAVGIDITADASCELGGVGCIDSVCRFCKVKTTEQSAAFVDCPGVDTTSSDATTEPVDASADTPDATSSASSLPADASETPIDTTATDIPQITPVDSSTSDSDEDNSDSEAPTTDDIDVDSSEASQGTADTTRSPDAMESPEDDNDTLTETPKSRATVTDTTTTEAPTKTPTVDADDVDWEGSESAEEDSDSTYDDSDASLEGI